MGGAGVGIFTNTGCLAGIGKLPAPALSGWCFGWYFWYCTFLQEPSFGDLAGTPFLKNSAGTPGGWYLVGIFGTVPFGGNPVLMIWWELRF
jgi:hypothetical protein